ncbi:MAG: hypothetical protein R2788_09465 [Saprospiraceae bacterium]
MDRHHPNAGGHGPAIFIKSKSTVNENYLELNLKNIGGSFNEIILGFKEALRIKPFRKTLHFYFFIFNAFNTVATFVFFVIVYHLFNGMQWPLIKDTGQRFLAVWGALSTTFRHSHCDLMSQNRQKEGLPSGRRVFPLLATYCSYSLIPGKPYMFIFALPFFSFGILEVFYADDVHDVRCAQWMN